MSTWNTTVLDSGNNNFSRNNTNVSAGGGSLHFGSTRQRSPSLGRQTAAHHAHTVEWMRKTLQPVDGPGRIPEVFVNAERRSHLGPAASAILAATATTTGTTATPRRAGDASYFVRHVSPNVGNRAPPLISEVLRSVSPSGPRVNNHRSWMTTQLDNIAANAAGSTNSSRAASRGGGGGYISLSPHRAAHQHCVSARMHSPSLSRAVSPAQFANTVRSVSQSSSADPSRRAWTPRRHSSSATRRNAPRWNDQLLHNTSGGASDPAATAVRDDVARLNINEKFSLATYRNVQRSAHSTLPVCQTVGTDTSNCSCAEDDRGDLMVHSIDLLLRANRGNGGGAGGGMSPARAKLVRANSSPVANRVENIVKKEVERRLQRERDLMAEQQRLRDEAAAAKALEAEQRHRAALMKAQAEAELASAKLNSEQIARARAESEMVAAQEAAARRRAEEEVGKLRAQIESIDTKLVSPGKVRVQEGLHPAGNAATAGVAVNNSRAAAATASSPSQSGVWTGGGGNNSNSGSGNGATSRTAAAAAGDVSLSDDDEFAGFNSVRRNAEQSTSANGRFDPVSSKAIQRAAQMRSNIHRDGATAGAAGGTPLAANRLQLAAGTSPSGASVASSGGGGNRAEVASVVSQLASAGSSPLANMDDFDDAMSGGATTPRTANRRGVGVGNSTPAGGMSAPRPSAQLFGNSPGGASLLNGNNTAAGSYFANGNNGEIPAATAVIPAPSLSTLAANFQPRLGTAGGGGMLAPTVGMRERDQHIVELMRRTQEKHRGANVNVNASRLAPSNYDTKSMSPSAAAAGVSGVAASRHPQVFVPVAELEQQQLLLAASPADSPPRSADRRYGGGYYAADGGGESAPRGASQRSNNNDGGISASVSPVRASGPAYAPETLVDPPMVAGPSGLWASRAASHASSAPSASQSRY